MRYWSLPLTLWLCGSLLAQEMVVQKSGVSEDLRGLSVVSSDVVWASGMHGTYLRTVDGGRSWRAAKVPGAEGLDFRDVEALSADQAYLLSAGSGEQSRIYKTADAGKHWDLQFINHVAKGFFDCMAFWDREHGIALGDPVAEGSGKLRFELLQTANGGRTWTSMTPESMPLALSGEGAFAASGSCIVIQGKSDVWFATGGSAARVFRSANRGKSWMTAETAIRHGNESAGIFSLAFRDVKHGVAVGGDYRHPELGGANIAVTDDGGANWRLAVVSPQAYFSAVAFAGMQSRGTTFLLAVGSSQVSLAPSLLGPTWLKTWSTGLNTVAASPGGATFGVGAKGKIVRFVDVQ